MQVLYLSRRCKKSLSRHIHYWYYDLAGNEAPDAYENVPATATVLYSAPAGPVVQEEWHTIPSGVSAEYVAHREIILLPGFTVERGATFVARIEPCPKCEERDIQVPSPQNDIPARVDEERDENDIMQSRPHIRTSQAVLPQAPLYPNPTSGEVTMEVDGEVEAVVVYNTMGQPVGGWRMLYLSPQRVTLDVGPLPAGPYLMTVRKTDETVLSSKFTKK